MFFTASQSTEILDELGEGSCEGCFRFRTVYVTECWVPGTVSDVRCLCDRCIQKLIVFGEAA